MQVLIQGSFEQAEQCQWVEQVGQQTRRFAAAVVPELAALVASAAVAPAAAAAASPVAAVAVA